MFRAHKNRVNALRHADQKVYRLLTYILALLSIKETIKPEITLVRFSRSSFLCNPYPVLVNIDNTNSDIIAFFIGLNK
jgi:hypothetical protein